MEQILNHYSRPLFIINNDVLIPFTNTLMDGLRKYFIHLAYLFYIITKISITTISFILWHLANEALNTIKNFKYMPELIVCVLTGLILGILFILDHQTRILYEQKKQIEFLKKSVNNPPDYKDELVYFKQQMESNYKETNNRLSDIVKNIKKMKKEIKNL
jgi:cell division protein FtsL